VLKAVCFDWFNTLAYTDPSREAMWAQALADIDYQVDIKVVLRGIMAADCEIKSPFGRTDPEAQLQAYLTYPRQIFRAADMTVPDDAPMRALEAVRKYYSGHQNFLIYDDVIETLVEFKARGLLLGLITNANLEMLKLYHELGLDQHLDFVATSEEAAAEKPDPAIFQLALDKAGVSAGEALHVGDQYEMDVVGAIGAGMRAVLLDRYDVNPDASYRPRITTLRELHTYLD
jgi:HAD superfamily hydrolase (TIGR01549 family)